MHVLLQRAGVQANHKKLRRLYAEERLQVKRRGGRKRALGTRRPMTIPDAPNRRWSIDFVSDAFTDCRRFRILTVVDDFTRECLALVPDTSISGLRVARELGCPRHVAITCADAVWSRCHRRIIADHLIFCGNEVAHLVRGRAGRNHPSGSGRAVRVTG